jgi:hypothetical protein
MKYLLFTAILFLASCNTSSTEKPRENDSALADGTRLVDTALISDSVPPHITNPQPD